MAGTPTVAIVGRPNVGKSTLFNRLVGRRQAIVHDQPGVTRDRLVGTADLETGRPVHWVDTGGLMFEDDPLGLNAQVRLAVEQSDAVLLVVDGREGLMPGDQRAAEELRPLGKPVLVVVNKGESRSGADAVGEFYRLGFSPPLVVSAEHGLGLGELRDRLSAVLPPADLTEEAPREAPAIAIVGRPNVGKSSLLNRIVGEERVLVSPQAGTTRDPIDTLLRRGGSSYLLIDTAGIRRRAKVSGTPEDLAVLMARRQVERAEVALLVIEAPQGVTAGDLAIAGAIWESGRAAVVAINKWDLLDELSRERLDTSWPRLAEVLADPPRVNISAASGRGIDKIFGVLDRALAAFRRQVTTGELNRLIEGAIEAHQAPAFADHRPWKFYYAAQVSTGPPTFMLFANRTLPIRHTYRRYLENRLRSDLGLAGVPIRLVVRSRLPRA